MEHEPKITWPKVGEREDVRSGRGLFPNVVHLRIKERRKS